MSFLKRLKYNPLAKKSKNKGIAMILALTSLVLMVYIATEVTKDSAVEYIVNSQELTRIKTYYAARNGLQIALLRIKIFQQASAAPLPAAFASQLDMIWQLPFSWPLPITSDINAVDRDTMKSIMSESLMGNDSSYVHTIEDEGSKIDLNDLASPSKVLRELTKKQLLNVFEQKISSDDEFRTAYQNTKFDELVNTIYDWMSDSNTSASGGDKRSRFSELGESYPPNRGFRTIEELRLVPGITDVFFDLLASRITIYGMKSINPNIASKEVLLSLDSGITVESVDEAIERRNDPNKGGPFVGETPEKCLENFKAFISKSSRLTPEFDQIPMVCNKIYNFRIKSDGLAGAGKYAMRKTITAVVLDLAKSASQIKSYVDTEKKAQTPAGTPPANPPPAAGSTSGTQKQDPLPKGPPRIVYWTEN